MKTTEQTSRSTFANARMLSEGAFPPPQGDVVQTMICVDLAGQLPPEALSLAKASEPRFHSERRTQSGFWDQILRAPS